jgi:hypothetical protein
LTIDDLRLLIFEVGFAHLQARSHCRSTAGRAPLIKSGAGLDDKNQQSSCFLKRTWMDRMGRMIFREIILNILRIHVHSKIIKQSVQALGTCLVHWFPHPEHNISVLFCLGAI